MKCNPVGDVSLPTTVQLVMYPVLQLNYYVLTRRKSEPIETTFSGHASAVLSVILTKETQCVAWLLYILSAHAASRRWRKTRERKPSSSLSRSPCIKSIKAPCSSRCSKLGGEGTTPLYTTPATLAFLQSCDTSRCLEELMAIENKKVFFSKRAPLYHYKNNVRPNSAHHVERYFLISLHCFNIRKTSTNAAAPSRCCVYPRLFSW